MKHAKVFVLLFLAALLVSFCGCDVITGAAVYEPPEPVNELSPLPELPAERWSGKLAEADLVVLGTITALQDTVLPRFAGGLVQFLGGLIPAQIVRELFCIVAHPIPR